MKAFRYFISATIWLVTLAAIGLSGIPRLEIMYPPSDRFETVSDKIPVIGRADCSDCVLFVGDYTTMIAPDGTFNYEMALKPGLNTIKVYLSNKAGNEFIRTLEITRNEVPIPGVAPLGVPPSATPAAPPAPPAAFADLQPAASPKVENPMISDAMLKEKHKAAADDKAIESIQKIAVSAAPPAREIEKNKIGMNANEKAANYNTIQFYLDGQPAEKSASLNYIIKKGHIFLTNKSPLWVSAGAGIGLGETIVFNDGKLLKQVVVSRETPLAFVEKGSIYLPVRSIFESAGRQVEWTKGRVYIDNLYHSCPITVGGGAGSGFTGIIYKGTIFARARDLSKIGIKLEQESGGIKLTGRGKRWIIVAKTSSRQRSRILIESGGIKVKSRHDQIQGPGGIIVDNEYSIPLRKASIELGFDTKWESAKKTAAISPEAIASRLN